MSAARHILVSYDIANRKRWRRAHRLVRQHGEMQQLSVYLCRLAPACLAQLREKLTRILHPQEDRLMIVDLGPAIEGCPALTSNAAPSDPEHVTWAL